MTRVRSARTGRFAPKGDAAAKPSETVTEGRSRGYQPSKAVLRALAQVHRARLAWELAPTHDDSDYSAAIDAAEDKLGLAIGREVGRAYNAEQKRKARRKAGR